MAATHLKEVGTGATTDYKSKGCKIAGGTFCNKADNFTIGQ